MPKKFLKDTICHNCKTDIGDANYCPNCGQINSHKQISLAQILKDLLGDYFTFDNKFFLSLWPLISKPGHLTNEYILGRRNTYILPLRLYIFTTFLFFLLLSLSHKVDPNQLDALQKNHVTQDSLYNFLEFYHQDIPQNLLERMILDLGLNYSIEKTRDRDISGSMVDTFRTYLVQANPQLDSLKADIYAHQLYAVFFHKREKNKTSEEDHRFMAETLDAFNFSEKSKGLFFAKLDSNYNYRKVKWKTETINVRIAGQDTASVAFIRKLEKKAEFIFAQGSKGWTIFWSEVIRQIPKIMFLVLPLFALLLKLFYVRQKIYYINHLIFSLHVHSLLFLYLIIAILWPNGWIIAGSILAIWVHTFIAFKNVYRQKLVLTFFKMNAILLLSMLLNGFVFILLSILAVWAA